MRDTLPMVANVLQEIAATPEENTKLKRLTRRRKALVDDKTRCINNFHADLQAVCPGLLEITGAADNLWFVRLIASVDELTRLTHLRRSTLLNIPGIGPHYADQIRSWQTQADFSTEVGYVGEMIIEDAQRLLALHDQIKRTLQASSIGQIIQSIPGYGPICSAELAGVVARSIASPAKAAWLFTWAWRHSITAQARIRERRRQGYDDDRGRPTS